MAGVLLSRDFGLLAVQGVARGPEDCEPRHLGPGLLGAGDLLHVWE